MAARPASLRVKARALLLLVLATVGCLGGPAAVEPQAGELGAASVAADGSLALDVPVDVVLVGFDAGTADLLRARLEPITVRHAWSDDWRDVPPNASRPPHAPSFKDAFVPLPAVPTARFRVHETSEAFAQRFLAAVASRPVPENASLLDANFAEDLLADELPGEGLALRTDAPSFVILHGRDVLPQRHAWRYTYPNGFLEPVRVFGERAPLVVLDASAIEDPYAAERYPESDAFYLALVGGTLEPVKRYDHPLASGGAGTADALAEAVADATQYRLLHGSAIPPSLAPCHAVSLVLAVRETSVADRLSNVTAEKLVDADALDRGWERMVGEGTVHVDLRVIRLPQDDPALDALTRPGAGAYGGTRGGYDAARFWLHENWAGYWKAREGCEAYVSIVILGDASDPLGTGFSGIALYDASDGHRVSFSMVPDLHRLFSEGPVAKSVGTEDPEVEAWGAASYLFSHETGHLMGPHHPHNNQRVDEGRVELRSFSSVWTPMSYQVGERSVEFGAIERANFLRNRAGIAAKAAHDAGLSDEPAFHDAMRLLAAQEWGAATELLLALR